jgi:Zn-finger nucleic acid-binding protein
MNCPKCNSDFEKVNYQGIEVDRCKECQGIWFDGFEHEVLKEMKGSESIDIGDPVKGKELNKTDKIDCPICKTQMIRIVDNVQPHIWFESCSICRGVFFDAGEFADFKEHTIMDYFKSFTTKARQ